MHKLARSIIMGRPSHQKQLSAARVLATAVACTLVFTSMVFGVTAQLFEVGVNASPPVQSKSPQPAMTVWQFVHRLVRSQATEPNTVFVLDQLEKAGKVMVDELDKRQNYYYNETAREILPLVRASPAIIDEETGERFQHWLERTFDVSYQWAKESDIPQYRVAAADFKAARDWISGLSNFNRFTEEHVQIVSDFLRAQAIMPDFRNKTPGTVYADFKKFVYADDSVAAGNSTALVRVRRGVFSPPRTDQGWKWWFKSIIDYIEDAVVVYNRAQTGMWPAKMAVSMIAPPVKFIWTGVDVFSCLFEEMYELTFAQSTEERWWDIFLCGLEFLGVIPMAGVLKFGLRILIRSTKIAFGIHSTPWYVAGPINIIKDWWSGSSVTTTPASAAFLDYGDDDVATTTLTPAIIGSM